MTSGQNPTRYRLEIVQYVGGSIAVHTASVILRTQDGEVHSMSATGDGPIEAVCMAISKIVNRPHTIVGCQPGSTGKGFNAVGRVKVRIKIGRITFADQATHTDIVQAAALAYLGAINMMLEVMEREPVLAVA